MKSTLGVLLALTASIPAARAADCDRECLRGVITLYLNAMVAHNPNALPVSGQVRFTEDTVAMKLGEGLWKTASGIRGYRQDILDVRQGVAASQVVVEEAGSPLMLMLRLIAEFYPAGLKIGSFVTVDAPFAPDAYRIENGTRVAGPGCSRAGCENIKTQTIIKHPAITTRVVGVDEELGIVLLRMNFGDTGNYGAGNALIVWEAFKVYGGQIHAVEAFMRVMPATAGSGWD